MAQAKKKKKAKKKSKFGWGGVRVPGPGKKLGRPPGPDPAAPHLKRADHVSKHPVHIEMRFIDGLPDLRRAAERDVIEEAFAAGRERFGFRLVQYAIQRQRLYLIVEAPDRDALSRGMQGLKIRTAKALNRLWGTRGSLFQERYRDRPLTTAKEVREALGSLLLAGHGSARRHRVAKGGWTPSRTTSARWFDGVRGFEPEAREEDCPVARPRTWLLREGWRRRGRLDPTRDAPKP